ncbi:(2Fe-2S) ferredoxin domain-containing protein [Aeromicrobium piscarium]|uniref:(2Fe-2S) ferredoxin domain-containing protein n=1 Tax=Aeromicrobium piscarium TaxID=2590901 RepID=A0A554S821_9ACTN|nr:(2Fe-2S) ferredoxin domain-containing protein [Aeromicrobium piscarium]TSD62477.1 (2Fe-2S) ferredoxin domain-containing protein [Aeromicrobium piscarium]
MPASVVIVAMAVDAVNDHSALAELAEVTGASVAYLQRGEPSLVDELSRLADDGVAHVRLVRLPAAGAAPARSWLRRVAAHWVREHPGVRVEVVASAVTGREAPLRSSAWEDVPGFRHHLLVCRGPRCSASGAATTAEALSTALHERELGDEDVLVTQTGCLFPCNHAPVVAVHPDDTWYGPVTGADVGELVDEHLIDGRPVDRLRRPRIISERTTS